MPFRRSRTPEVRPALNARYIPLPSKPPSQLKDWQALNHDVGEAILVEIRKAQEHAKKSKISSHDSLYTGVSGIAFMEYHLAGMRIPLHSEILAPKKLLAIADKNLARVLRHNPINMEYMYSPSRLSFLETNIGVAVLVIIRGLVTTEQTIVDNWHPARDYLEYALRQTLAADADAYSPGDKEDGCEVLYGRAGMLYALLYLRKALDQAQVIPDMSETVLASLQVLTSDDTIQRLVDSIVTRGQHGGHVLASEFRAEDAKRLPPLMWSWRGKRYLGGAHGVAGILQILLRCPISIISKHIPNIFKTISWLMEIQGDDGNWSAKCPNQSGISSDSELVQWCHGATGIVILFSTAIGFLKTHEQFFKIDHTTVEKLRGSLQLGAEVVYRQGLLKKGVGLCHGVAGSVYALLAASDALDGTSSSFLAPVSAMQDLPSHINRCKHFARAAHLAFLAKFHNDKVLLPDMGEPDHPFSLYEGLSGACCAWAEIVCRMDTKDPRRAISGMPGYDDL
ncbi:hypothetical protein CPB83DRAFT_877463 [Crepidotus variabilis]|uniref:Lanthionine synthetase C family protein n=1 Tax=Crepidotus variabilis TaxID=179855 RepID=A0A9P6E9I9_9AGAR|nr:hypothetical protein CPB83DRAFT_877463 [Crepidotus variabilis]